VTDVLLPRILTISSLCKVALPLCRSERKKQKLLKQVHLVKKNISCLNQSQFLDIALKSKAICARYNVPLLINDRIDIALAIGADGVHVGQTDMPVDIARKLLPKNSVIGVSCNNVQELQKALEDGADYVGIGAVYATQTKDLNKPLVGVRGVGPMLRLLDGTSIKAVAIGT